MGEKKCYNKQLPVHFNFVGDVDKIIDPADYAYCSFYGNIKEGKVIQVPSNYCKNILLYIDESTMLPLTISIYDDIGIFENYEYSNVKTNRKFGPDDFGKFYKD